MTAKTGYLKIGVLKNRRDFRRVMAASSSCASESSACKRCKVKPVNGLKCIGCDTYFHASCAKLLNVKFVDEKTVLCCDAVLNAENTENDDTFFDAVIEIGGGGKKVDIEIFKYVIKQKNAMIQELNERILVLNNQIDLLNQIQRTSNTGNKKSQELQKSKGHVNKKRTVIEKKPENVSMDCLPLQIQNKQTDKEVITKTDMTAAILQAQSQLKVDKYININNDLNDDKNDEVQQEEWKEVRNKNKKRRLSRVIGSNKEIITVAGVPRWVDLHVYRIKPNTTPSQIVDMLQSHIPEVKCEAITPKYPGLYASFRVSIHDLHFRTAMNPELWPVGACVSRFFHPRVADQRTTI